MPETLIIALSGRKFSGKTTLCDHIQDVYPQTFRVNGSECQEYAFADSLKAFCVNVLGLDSKQCYGSEEEKNSPTDYRWEDVLWLWRWKFGSKEMSDRDSVRQTLADGAGEHEFYGSLYGKGWMPSSLMRGRITGREMMQLVGTELIRDNFGNVWLESTFRRIQRDNTDLAIITDCRFENEVNAVLKRSSGHVIRLTRSVHSDNHASETSLDAFDWNHPKCHVLDNARMDIESSKSSIENILETIIRSQKERAV